MVVNIGSLFDKNPSLIVTNTEFFTFYMNKLSKELNSEYQPQSLTFGSLSYRSAVVTLFLCTKYM